MAATDTPIAKFESYQPALGGALQPAISRGVTG